MNSKVFKNFLFSFFAIILFFVSIEISCRLIDGPRRFEYPKIFEYDKDKVFSLKKNLTDGKFAEKLCRTNSFGYRDTEILVKKADNAVRIVAIGDSVTFGHGVTQDEAYPNRLEYLLNEKSPARHFDVINTAVPGNSPFQEFYDFKRALIFKPDIAIFQYNLNDVIEPYKVFRRFGASGMDYHKVMDVPFWHHWLSERSRFYLYLRYAYVKVREKLMNKEKVKEKVEEYNQQINWRTAVYPPDTMRDKEVWADCLKWIQRQADLCHENGIDCIVFVSPSERQIYDDKKTYFQDVIKDFAEREGIYFIDILGILKFEVKQRLTQEYNIEPTLDYNKIVLIYKEDMKKFWGEYFIDIDHYTPRGHEFVAGLLKEAIDKILRDQSGYF